MATTGRIGKRLAGGALSWSAGDPLRRTGLGVVLAGGLALAAVTWWPNGEYDPIQPGERGTIASAARAVADIPTGRPSLTAEREAELGGAPDVRNHGGDFRERPAAREDKPSSSSEDEGADKPRDTTTAPAGTATAPPDETSTAPAPAPEEVAPEPEPVAPAQPEPVPAPEAPPAPEPVPTTPVP